MLERASGRRRSSRESARPARQRSAFASPSSTRGERSPCRTGRTRAALYYLSSVKISHFLSLFGLNWKLFVKVYTTSVHDLVMIPLFVRFDQKRRRADGHQHENRRARLGNGRCAAAPPQHAAGSTRSYQSHSSVTVLSQFTKQLSLSLGLA